MPGYDDYVRDEDEDSAKKKNEQSSESVKNDGYDSQQAYSRESYDENDESSSEADGNYNTNMEADGNYNTSMEADVAEKDKEAEPLPAIANPAQTLQQYGFSFQKTLRAGGISGGSLDLYTYSGDDPQVKALLHDGLLLLKTESTVYTTDETDPKKAKQIQAKIDHAHATFRNEFDNISDVLANNNNDDGLMRPRLLAMQFGDQKFIFNECIYQDPAAKKAENLFEYMESMYKVDYFLTYQSPDVDTNLLRKQERIAQLDKMFESIVVAQNQLHDHQLLHLDTAARNYCLLPDGGLKMIDFGASLKMNAEGKIEGKRPYGFTPTHFFDQAALASYNQGKQSTSIQTDLFARRMTMIEMLAIYMGFNTDELLTKGIFCKGLLGFDSYDPNKTNMQVFIRQFGNNERLEAAFNNLMNEAMILRDANDVRGDVVIEQLKKYQPYLTNLPVLTSLAEIRAEENKAFTSCTRLQKDMQRLMSILENPKELDKVKSDPIKLRKFVHELEGCVAACQKAGLPEKISGTPAYKEFAEIREKFKAKKTEAASTPTDTEEAAPTTPRAKF